MRSLTYIPSRNLYLGVYGIYSEYEVEAADKEEKEWRLGLHNYRLPELLDIFFTPAQAKRYLKNKIKECKDDLSEAQRLERAFKNLLYKVPLKEHWFWELVIDELYVKPLRDGRDKKIKTYAFLLSGLKGGNNKGEVNDAKIAQARQVPITNFIEFGRSGFARCPWHNERTPSLFYYKNSNRVYCFGCSRAEDVIGVVMELNQISFIEAVKRLV